MRRQMFGGIDFLSGGQIKISQGTSKTWWQKFSEKVYQLIDKITPHKDDVKEISAKYDKSIEGFFQFYRFVVSYSIMMFGFFIPLIVFHSIKSSGSDYTTLWNYLPCYFYYSRFQSSIDYIYTITYVWFWIVGMIIWQVQWTQFTINQQRSSIYINEDIYFSKLLFSSWNWNIKSFDESDDSLNLMVNETSTAVYEDLIKDKIKKRPKSEKIKLIIRRAILISINILIILLGVTAIFLVNLYSTSIKNSINVATVVTNQIPSLIVSFVNASVPTMTKKITVLEKYDFRNTLLKQQIWRNFATKILNLSIYTLLNYELAFNKSFFKSSSVISYDSSYSWREDQAGTNLARLVLTEFWLKVIMTFAWMFFNCCKGGCGAKKGWRGEFLVSDEAVWLLYFHTVVWVAIVWNPFMSLIYPFMFYFFFKFIMFKLTKMQKKPLNTTNVNFIWMNYPFPLQEWENINDCFNLWNLWLLFKFE